MSDSKKPSENSTQGEQHDILDVRTIPPAQRHLMIFARFNALPVGGGFMLINDHDPKPLYYQLNFEYSGQLGWEYLEQGPRVWRVRISRIAAAGNDPRCHIALHPMTKTAE
jgi:uncharacterized protein (DUF2249 family)